MDFRYLKAFLATARQGSFSKAAEELNIAQSAVSRQIKLLEESIGDELILRSSKQITLTPKGKEIFDLSSTFVSRIDKVLVEDSQKEIRIGIFHGLLEQWFPDILKAYYSKNTNNMHISVADFQKLQERLNKGKYDIIFTPFNIQNDIMTSRLIFEESRKLVSSKPIDFDSLHEQRWIIYNNEDLLLKIGKNPSKKYIEVNSITSMLRFVKDGLGVAILPDHMLKSETGLYTLELPKHDKSPIYMSTLNYSSLPKYLKSLINEMISQPPK